MRLFLLLLFALCNGYCHAQKHMLGHGKAAYAGIVKPKDGQKVSCQGVQGQCGSKKVSCGGPSFNNLSFFYSIYSEGGHTAYIDFSVPAFLSYNRIYTNKEGNYDEYTSTIGLGQVDEDCEIAIEYEIRFGGDKYVKEGTIWMANDKGVKTFSIVTGGHYKKVAEVNKSMLSIGGLLPKQTKEILEGPNGIASVRITNAYVVRWHDDNKFDVCNKIACKGASAKDREANNSSSSSNSNSSKGNAKRNSNYTAASNASENNAYAKASLDWNKFDVEYADDPEYGNGMTSDLKTAQELVAQEFRWLDKNVELNTLYCSSIKYSPISADFNVSGKCTISYELEDYTNVDCDDRYSGKVSPYRTRYTYEFDMKDIEKIGYVVQHHPRADNAGAKIYGLILNSNGDRIRETKKMTKGGVVLLEPTTRMVSNTQYIMLEVCKGNDCGGFNNDLYKYTNYFRLKVRNHEKERNEDPNFWDDGAKMSNSNTINKSSDDFWEKGKNTNKKDTVTTPKPAPKKDDFWK